MVGGISSDSTTGGRQDALGIPVQQHFEGFEGLSVGKIFD
jgi:hypothetical protein